MESKYVRKSIMSSNLIPTASSLQSFDGVKSLPTGRQVSASASSAYKIFLLNFIFMCYSKEVQAATGCTTLLFALCSYILYSIKYKNMQEKWLLPFLKNVIFFFAMFGGHQFLEFLALAMNSQFFSTITKTNE